MQESRAADVHELPRRVEDLFKRFRNESVAINEKRFNCPHFAEVGSRTTLGRACPVFARNEKVRWFCQIFETEVLEEDVQRFCSDLKRLRGPVQKKLIIGLKGIDLNAKLLAQEAKIQYLDLKSLNVLLDLYDAPKVVVA